MPNLPMKDEVVLLLGKQVTVTLDENVVITGRLLGFGQTGEFEIEDSCGDIHYCWPMLKVEEL